MAETDSPGGAAEPTPWAVAKRMMAEGHAHAVIIERLKQMGLDAADIDLLLQDLPRPNPHGTADDGVGGDMLRVGAYIAGGPLVGLAVSAAIAASRAQPEEADGVPREQTPLDAADPSQRCAWHPTLASIGS